VTSSWCIASTPDDSSHGPRRAIIVGLAATAISRRVQATSASVSSPVTLLLLHQSLGRCGPFSGAIGKPKPFRLVPGNSLVNPDDCHSQSPELPDGDIGIRPLVCRLELASRADRAPMFITFVANDLEQDSPVFVQRNSCPPRCWKAGAFLPDRLGEKLTTLSP